MLQLDFFGSFAAGVRGRLAIRNLAQDDIPSDRDTVDEQDTLLRGHESEVHDMRQWPDGKPSEEGGEELFPDGSRHLPRLALQCLEAGIKYDQANGCEDQLVDCYLGEHCPGTYRSAWHQHLVQHVVEVVAKWTVHAEAVGGKARCAPGIIFGLGCDLSNRVTNNEASEGGACFC